MAPPPTARSEDRGLDCAARFAAAFGRGGELHRAHAPGRVNLIGEHIDYCDLAVLPMALEQGLTLTFRARGDGRVRLVSNDARFGFREFELAGHLPTSPAGDWVNYPKASAQALVRDLGCARGFDGLLDADLPAAAGLSSSAALVVATALALLCVGERALEPLQLAEFCAQAEHYVGTRGGGMDQAACVLGRRDHALRIDFAPLRASPIAIPAHWRFVIADSLVAADKSGALRAAYNRRRAEVGEVLRRLGATTGAATWTELLELTPAGVLAARAEECLDNRLLARFRHVSSETLRVERACRALAEADAPIFGALLDRSHASLRDDCEVSHPALERLVESARAGGARGARLTGAGFGGSIVALVDAEGAGALVEHLRGSLDLPVGRSQDPREPVWIARAGDGASLDGRVLGRQ